MKYGRVDASGPDQSPEEGRLPGMSSLAYLCALISYIIQNKY